MLEKIKVFIGGTGLGQFMHGGLALVRAAFEIVLKMHHNGRRKEVVHNDKSNVFTATLKPKQTRLTICSLRNGWMLWLSYSPANR